MYVKTIVALVIAIAGTFFTVVLVGMGASIALPLVAIVMLLPVYLTELDRKEYGKIGFPNFVLSWLALLILFCMGMFFYALWGTGLTKR